MSVVFRILRKQRPYDAAVNRLAQELANDPHHRGGAISIQHRGPNGEPLTFNRDRQLEEVRKLAPPAAARINVHHGAACAAQLTRTGDCLCQDPRVELIRPEPP
jgi:hypothetical protein